MVDAQPSGKCRRCVDNDATTWWTGEGGTLAFIRGWAQAWCERCCTEEQLKYARDAAARVSALEEKLEQLGGPMPTPEETK